jgi:uncharacterized protein (DUF2141 family)
LKGRGFSRAVNAPKSSLALAPEGMPEHPFGFNQRFPKAQFPALPFDDAAESAPFQNREIARSEEFFRSLFSLE